MEDSIAELILSGHRKYSHAVVQVYVALRADLSLNRTPLIRTYKSQGNLVSGLLLEEIQSSTGLPALSVKRTVGELKRMGWIKDIEGGFELGTIINGHSAEWFRDVHPSAPKPPKGILGKAKDDSGKIEAAEVESRRRDREERVKLPSQTQRALAGEALGGLVREEKAATKAIREFESRYLEKYEERYPRDGKKSFWGKRHVYVDRALRLVNNDLTRFCQLLDFMFEHWDLIRPEMGFPEDARPSINMIGSKRIFMSILEWTTTHETRVDRGGKTDPSDIIGKKKSGKESRMEKRWEESGEDTPEDVAW